MNQHGFGASIASKGKAGMALIKLPILGERQGRAAYVQAGPKRIMLGTARQQLSPAHAFLCEVSGTLCTVFNESLGHLSFSKRHGRDESFSSQDGRRVFFRNQLVASGFRRVAMQDICKVGAP
jgi:hypothetical protein